MCPIIPLVPGLRHGVGGLRVAFMIWRRRLAPLASRERGAGSGVRGGRPSPPPLTPDPAPHCGGERGATPLLSIAKIDGCLWVRAPCRAGWTGIVEPATITA